MNKQKILIAGSKETFNNLKKQISVIDFDLLDYSFSGNDIVRKTNIVLPSIIITDFVLSDMTGLDLAKTIEELHICPVVILCTPQQCEFVQDLKANFLDIFCITKPINELVLNHTISLAIKLSKKITDYENQITHLKKQLQDRKVIEKAKGILMKKFNMSEAAAFKELRTKSMTLSKPIEEISQTIITMFEKVK
jgi:response regulator NasT